MTYEEIAAQINELRAQAGACYRQERELKKLLRDRVSEGQLEWLAAALIHSVEAPHLDMYEVQIYTPYDFPVPEERLCTTGAQPGVISMWIDTAILKGQVRRSMKHTHYSLILDCFLPPTAEWLFRYGVRLDPQLERAIPSLLQIHQLANPSEEAK